MWPILLYLSMTFVFSQETNFFDSYCSCRDQSCTILRLLSLFMHKFRFLATMIFRLTLIFFQHTSGPSTLAADVPGTGPTNEAGAVHTQPAKAGVKKGFFDAPTKQPAQKVIAERTMLARSVAKSA